MKVALCISLFSLAALGGRAEAQLLCALGGTDKPDKPYDAMVDMPPSTSAQNELKKVKGLLCAKTCGKVFLFANATTPNTVTVTDGNGTSKIAYSPNFVKSVQTNFGPIATLGIVAHELGHHIDATGDPPAWMKDSWDEELRADAWAGCALAKAELKPSGLQAALLAMWTYPSAAHPPWSARRPAITAGFVQCGGRTLPPLSKDEGNEGAIPPKKVAKNEKSDKSGKSDRSEPSDRNDEPLAVGGPAGCSGSRDCRNGRACINKRCAVPPPRHRCGKDTDCPEPDECGTAGYCEAAAGSVRAEEDDAKPAKDEPKAPKVETLAALQERRASGPTAPPPPSAKDVAACTRSCDEVRDHCVEAATGEVSRCIGVIQSDPTYRACTCPNYPSGNYACYRFCTNAYEQGKSCAGGNQIRECKSEGERCRSECQ